MHVRVKLKDNRHKQPMIKWAFKKWLQKEVQLFSWLKTQSNIYQRIYRLALKTEGRNIDIPPKTAEFAKKLLNFFFWQIKKFLQMYIGLCQVRTGGRDAFQMS